MSGLALAAWTLGKSVTLAAVLLGALGTGLLYWGSFAYESFPYWGDRAAWKAQTDRNAGRRRLQRAGFGLLLVSFLLQALALLLP